MTTAAGPTCDGGPAVSLDEAPDYPDWISLDGRLYFLQGTPAQPVTLGRVIMKTRCQLVDSGTRRGYQPQDGDATVLPAGTDIYEVAGAAPSAVIATRTSDGIEVWRPE